MKLLITKQHVAGNKSALCLIDVFGHFLFDTVWPYPGTSEGQPIPDVPAGQPPSACLDKAHIPFTPLFPWEGNMSE